MQTHRLAKYKELFIPVVFALLWGVFAIWLRTGRSVM